MCIYKKYIFCGYYFESGYIVSFFQKYFNLGLGEISKFRSDRATLKTPPKFHSPAFSNLGFSYLFFSWKILMLVVSGSAINGAHCKKPKTNSLTLMFVPPFFFFSFLSWRYEDRFSLLARFTDSIVVVNSNYILFNITCLY